MPHATAAPPGVLPAPPPAVGRADDTPGRAFVELGVVVVVLLLAGLATDAVQRSLTPFTDGPDLPLWVMQTAGYGAWSAPFALLALATWSLRARGLRFKDVGLRTRDVVDARSVVVTLALLAHVWWTQRGVTGAWADLVVQDGRTSTHVWVAMGVTSAVATTWLLVGFVLDRATTLMRHVRWPVVGAVTVTAAVSLVNANTLRVGLVEGVPLFLLGTVAHTVVLCAAYLLARRNLWVPIVAALLGIVLPFALAILAG